MIDTELQEILRAREERWSERLRLAPHSASLLSATLCIPLPGRTEPSFCRWFEERCDQLLTLLRQEGFDPVLLERRGSADGPVMLVGCGCSPETLKRRCVEWEEALPGGRMLDLDVMGPDLRDWSRRDLGLPPRRCFLCGRDAAVCVVERAHSREEILRFARSNL